jgi:methyl-accepting chemotaxis protein
VVEKLRPHAAPHDKHIDALMQMQTAGEEIAAASRDLAARTEANAASLEETAAASNSLSDRAKRLADEISFSKPR